MQGVVSGVVAGFTDYFTQAKDVGYKNVDFGQVTLSVFLGGLSGYWGGDGVRHKKGEVIKSKKLYDNFVGTIKMGKWNSKDAGLKLSYLSQNYRKVLNKSVTKTTWKYSLGSAAVSVAKRWMPIS